MNEKDAQIILAKKINYVDKIVIPNLLAYDNGTHEMDLVVVNTKGKFLTEIEIKLSRADFLNDFKKKDAHKHKHVKYFYYAMPEHVYSVCKNEIPNNAGVFIIEPECKIIKRPTANKYEAVSDKKLLEYCRLLGIRFWKSLNQQARIN